MSLSNNFPTTPPSLNLDFANVKALDPRVTFTRSTTATYYDGVTVAMAEQNLLQYSQEFDNVYWNTASNVTISANSTTAPDGTSTADTMTEAATTATHRVSANSNGAVVVSALTSSTVYTLSCYYKVAAGSPFALLYSTDNTGTNYARAWFNLGTGAVGTSTTNNATIVGTTITSVGSSWYRCTMTYSINAGINLYAFIAIADADASISYAGSTGRAVYIWGAQLEQRSSVTAYTATTTQPITNYIPVLQTAASGVPRFDHNPTTGESLGFLIEEARTNLFTYSAQFDNAAWTLGATTVTANTIVAPDGTLTGDKLIADATSSVVHNIRQAVTSSGVPVTFSFYAKQGEYPKCGIREGAATGGYATFNLSTGAVIEQTVGTATITAVGNGWYRCTFTLTATNPRADLYPLPSAYTSGSPISYTYTGNGYSGIYLWGAQAEAGAFPTSYIATTTAAATRNADAASMTGTNFSSWYDAGEGTLFAEFNASTGVSYCAPTSLYTDANNEITIVGGTPGVGAVGFVVITDGSVQANPGTRALGQKIAGAYKLNDFAVSTNGAAAATDTSGTVPSISTLGLGNSYSSSYLNGHLRRVAYYPARLTNAQLQAITS